MCLSTFAFAMTLPPSSSESEIHGNAPEPVAGAVPIVNPKLSATLSSDYEALQNDMQQARELAGDFQRQLAGKSNEFAQLKQVFEKTLADLAHLQAGIVELRSERHHLANEAMRATALQMKLEKATAERDRLRVDVDVMRTAMAQIGEDMSGALRARDVHIASLVIEVVTLKEALAEARRGSHANSFHEPTPITLDGAPRTSQDEEIEISFHR